MVWVLPMVVVVGVLGDSLPPFSIVELHPIIFAILNLATVLEGLSEQITKEVVVGGVLETEVANVAQILIELVWIALAGIHFVRGFRGV